MIHVQVGNPAANGLKVLMDLDPEVPLIRHIPFILKQLSISPLTANNSNARYSGFNVQYKFRDPTTLTVLDHTKTLLELGYHTPASAAGEDGPGATTSTVGVKTSVRTIELYDPNNASLLPGYPSDKHAQTSLPIEILP